MNLVCLCVCMYLYLYNFDKILIRVYPKLKLISSIRKPQIEQVRSRENAFDFLIYIRVIDA